MRRKATIHSRFYGTSMAKRLLLQAEEMLALERPELSYAKAHAVILQNDDQHVVQVCLKSKFYNFSTKFFISLGA